MVKIFANPMTTNTSSFPLLFAACSPFIAPELELCFEGQRWALLTRFPWYPILLLLDTRSVSSPCWSTTRAPSKLRSRYASLDSCCTLCLRRGNDVIAWIRTDPDGSHKICVVFNGTGHRSISQFLEASAQASPERISYFYLLPFFTWTKLTFLTVRTYRSAAHHKSLLDKAYSMYILHGG